MQNLTERLLAGEVRALARGISLVEQGTKGAAELLRAAFSRTGRATVIGVTGSPGAGKSSLVDRLVFAYRADGRRVGVIAVDPSSAYSGGAILGDRIRMQAHSADPGVFIRSMATRGYLGGLARASNDAVDLLDAAGYDTIIVETVGVGQDEIDVVKCADAVAVVLVPGMGDDIQAIKAGILEIADLFVINKADRPGTDRLEAELAFMLSLVPEGDRPKPGILRTVATSNAGVPELVAGLDAYIASLDGPRRAARRRERADARFRAVLSERLLERVLREALGGGAVESVVDAIAERGIDPYTAADEVLARLEVR